MIDRSPTPQSENKSQSTQTAYTLFAPSTENPAEALFKYVTNAEIGKAKAILIKNPEFTQVRATCIVRGHTLKNVTPYQAALCVGDAEMCEMIKEVRLHQDLDIGAFAIPSISSQFEEIFPKGYESHLNTQKVNAAALNFTDLETSVKEGQLSVHFFEYKLSSHMQKEKVFNPQYFLHALRIYKKNYSEWRDLTDCKPFPEKNWKELGSPRLNLTGEEFMKYVLKPIEATLPASYQQAYQQIVTHVAKDLYNVTNWAEVLYKSFEVVVKNKNDTIKRLETEPDYPEHRCVIQ